MKYYDYNSSFFPAIENNIVCSIKDDGILTTSKSPNSFRLFITNSIHKSNVISILIDGVGLVDDQHILKIAISSNRVVVSRVFINDYDSLISESMSFINNCLNFPMLVKIGD